MFKLNHNGFTLSEVMVTVIIIGVMASLAIPSFMKSVERMRASEGYQILIALLIAQKSYEIEQGAYATTIGVLDVVIPTSSNFAAITDSEISSSNPIASVKRGSGTIYTLTIDIDGTIKCSNGTGPVTCAQLGCTKGAGSDECN